MQIFNKPDDEVADFACSYKAELFRHGWYFEKSTDCIKEDL